MLQRRNTLHKSCEKFKLRATMLSRTVNNRRPLQQPCARARACFVARASVSSTSQQQQQQLLDEELLLADLRVVLVAPKTEANVGAVCRAMANFEVRARAAAG